MNVPQSSIEPFGYIGIPQFNILTDVGEFGTDTHHDAYLRIKATVGWWFWQHYNSDGTPDKVTLHVEQEIARLGARNAKWHTNDDGHEFSFTLHNWTYTLFFNQ